jgi:hypothetical protein
MRYEDDFILIQRFKLDIVKVDDSILFDLDQVIEILNFIIIHIKV